MQPKRLVLMGIQGSGKGAQAHKIIENFDYILFDTGAELRKIAKNNTPLGNKIRAIQEAGNFVPASDLREVIIHFIEKNSDQNILFDGPIRTNEQDSIIREVLWEFQVIHLELDINTALDRLVHRRIDSETGEVFPANFKGDINPRTGNPLVKRTDDTPRAIHNRINTSIKETLPIIEVWEQDGYETFHINADDSIDNIFNQISDILKK